MHVVLDEGVVSLSSHPHGFRTVEGGATNRGAKMLAPSSELSVATLGSPVIEVSVDRNAFCSLRYANYGEGKRTLWPQS